MVGDEDGMEVGTECETAMEMLLLGCIELDDDAVEVVRKHSSVGPEPEDEYSLRQTHVEDPAPLWLFNGQGIHSDAPELL